jgi:hypothetical protein
MVRSFLSALVLSAAGCAADRPSSASVPAGREFEVKAGESVSVPGADLGLRFVNTSP